MAWDHISRLRRRLQREQGTILKDWGGRLPVALIYPNSYYLGMSSLGLQTLYGLFNSYPNLVCERVFFEKDSPPLSLESQRPLHYFALLAFSLSYELDYWNALEMLRKANIPLLASEQSSQRDLRGWARTALLNDLSSSLDSP